MKKPPFPTWNLIAIAMMSLFFIGFYMSGKLTVNCTWEKNWVEISIYVLGFFIAAHKAGIEWNKISEYVKFARLVRSNSYNAMYEYLREYLFKYKDSEKPKKEIFKNTFLIRLTTLNSNKTLEAVTDEVCKNIHVDEKNKVIELNMLIDYWIEEFINLNNNNSVSNEDQFNVMSFLLTNACLEDKNNEVKL